MVVAIKNGNKQTFSDLAWKMLGKNKNGWQEISVQQITNSVAPLPTGEKPIIKEPVKENKGEKHLKDFGISVTGNNIHQGGDIDFENPVVDVPGITEDQRIAFMESITDLNKRAVMDLLDKEAQPYNKKADSIALKQQLAAYVNYSSERLTEIMTK